MNIKECYQRLELPITATESETRQAYKNLVKRWHPDRYEIDSPMKAYAEERIKIINVAYDCIRKHHALNRVNTTSPDSPRSAREYKPDTSSDDGFQNIREFKRKLNDTIKNLAAALKGIFICFNPIPPNPPEMKKSAAQSAGKKTFERVLGDFKGNNPRKIISKRLKYNGFKSIYHLRRSYGPRRSKGVGPVSGVDCVEKNQSIRPVNKVNPIGRVR